MRPLRPIRLIPLCLVLAACSGDGPVRYAADPVPVTQKVGIHYGAISVRDISLPSYASGETIAIEGAGGQLNETTDILWADDPVREATLRFAQALAAITGARVAPDPWPYSSVPQVVVDIRMERFVPRSNGQFVASGQYFVAPDEGMGSERAGTFTLAVPFDPAGGYGAIAAARAAVLTQLALTVAQRGLR